jgi:cyclohexa-1,5-dienecarbonyl-CoA hydratase
MSAPQTITLERDARVARVTLNRPPLNVMDTEMMHAMSSALEEALGGEHRAEFVVFRGAGARGFSAGAEVKDHTPDRVRGMLAAFHRVFRQLWGAEAISIAQVHGHCLGGGCELATFCDFVIAAETARFGQPEIKLGCFPPVALVTLPMLAGPRAALDLILTGRVVAAAEAHQMGLVTRVAPDGRLEEDVAALLDELKGLSGAVLRMTRRTMWRAAGFDFEGRLAEVEDVYLNELIKTPDAREGIEAFLEKRPPVWQGR